MKRLLNTLFVSTQGTYLSKDGESVAVKIEGKIKLRIPILTLGSIVCFGNVTCSPYLMGFCAEKGVSISFLTEYGRFLARVAGPVSGNVLLRREQYRKADDENISTSIAESIITSKLINTRAVIERTLRDHGGKINITSLKKASASIKSSIRTISSTSNLHELRGIEGEAASMYFSGFDDLILSNKSSFHFRKRSRRPPMDNVNSMLSYLYTILMHDVRAGIESVGLDPAVGFLHRDRPGRYGLALDLMEEFRAFIADRMVLSLINREQVKPKDFTKTDAGAVHMDDGARKTLLVAYQERKQKEINHPFLNEKVKVGLLFHIQALLFARYIRGDLDGYPAFIWR